MLNSLFSIVHVPLIDMTNFIFTVNLGGWTPSKNSTLRPKVNREEHADVPEQFMRWVWAGGRKLKGLVRRREAEADLYAQ